MDAITIRSFIRYEDRNGVELRRDPLPEPCADGEFRFRTQWPRNYFRARIITVGEWQPKGDLPEPDYERSH